MANMTRDELLKHAKAVCRITTEDEGIEAEIDNLIDAAIEDLILSGVRAEEPFVPLIVRAIALYCKANFGFDNPDSEKLMESYRSLEIHLSLSDEYRGVVVDETP